MENMSFPAYVTNKYRRIIFEIRKPTNLSLVAEEIIDFGINYIKALSRVIIAVVQDAFPIFQLILTLARILTLNY